MSENKNKKYQVGDMVDLNEVNDIKNLAFEKAWINRVNWKTTISWETEKKDIKKKIIFKIIDLKGLNHERENAGRGD